MSRTPRVTPSAPVPRPSQHPVSVSAIAPLVRAPILVVAPDGQHELDRGILSIGRQPTCDVVLDDPLVSRVHARIVILDNSGAVLDDLHSTNGVYVNGSRLGRQSQRLRDGDRLLIGTFELGIFSSRTAPEARGQTIGRSKPLRSMRPEAEARASRDTDGAPATDRADALEMVGRLARRLNQSGNAVEAVRVLSAHLNKVLLGASAGLKVPPQVLDDACYYAVELFGWTYNAAWLDYVVELHLTAQHLPSEPSVNALEIALSTPGGAQFDVGLLHYFLESLEPQRRSMNLNQEARFLRLRRLAPLTP
jgi:hypothetical protein